MATKQTLDKHWIVWEIMKVQALMEKAGENGQKKKEEAFKKCLNELALAQDSWLEATHTSV